ncbi:unnamed protein product [Closterium sp. Yama58-4]|nr:unnamed protein product [Closterium sp. Yama58-4]
MYPSPESETRPWEQRAVVPLEEMGAGVRKYEVWCRHTQPPSAWQSWGIPILIALFALLLVLLVLLAACLQRAKFLQTQQQVAEADRLRREADEAEASKSMFVACMSHELRAPMVGIIGMLDALADMGLDSSQLEDLLLATASAKRTLHLVNRVLDLAKLEAGKAVVDETVIDMREWLRAALDCHAEVAHSKGIQLSGSVSTDCPTHVIVDPLHLSNALKEITGGPSHVGCHRWAVTRGLPQSVGDGECLTPVIVDPFHLSNAVKEITGDLNVASGESREQREARSGSGAALGLVLVQQTVTLLKGELALDSEPGCGSTVAFSVPVALPSLQEHCEKELQSNIQELDHQEEKQEQNQQQQGETARHDERRKSRYEQSISLCAPATTTCAAGTAICADARSGADTHTGAGAYPAAGAGAGAGTGAGFASGTGICAVAGTCACAGAGAAGSAADSAVMRAWVGGLCAGTGAVAGAAAAAGAADEAVTRAWVGGLRVLVVDDTPVNLLVARRSLARWGAIVTTASSGQQAMDLIAAGVEECSLARWGARNTTTSGGEQALELVAAGVEEGGRGEEQGRGVEVGRGQQEARGKEAGAMVLEAVPEARGTVGEVVTAGAGGAEVLVEHTDKGVAAGMAGSRAYGMADSKNGAMGVRAGAGRAESKFASFLSHRFAATEAIRALERKLVLERATEAQLMTDVGTAAAAAAAAAAATGKKEGLTGQQGREQLRASSSPSAPSVTPSALRALRAPSALSRLSAALSPPHVAPLSNPPSVPSPSPPRRVTSRPPARRVASLPPARRVNRRPGPRVARRPGPRLARRPGPRVARRPGPRVARRPGPRVARRPGPRLARRPGPRVARRPGPRLARTPWPPPIPTVKTAHPPFPTVQTALPPIPTVETALPAHSHRQNRPPAHSHRQNRPPLPSLTVHHLSPTAALCARPSPNLMTLDYPSAAGSRSPSPVT